MIKFSVIIPTYNASSTIVDTIKSCLDQTHQPFEIIVINDCSTDNSIELISQNFGHISILKIHNCLVNQGVAKARNLGWNFASGDYVAFLDSDDRWHPTKLQIFSNILSKNSFACIGHFYTNNIKLFGVRDQNFDLVNVPSYKLIIKNYFNTSSIVVKRDLTLRFNESMRYTEDHELLLRISLEYNVKLLQQYLTLLNRPQLTVGGLSGNKWEMRKGEIKMYFFVARSYSVLFLFIPILVPYSLFKHLLKIFRQ